MYVVRSIGVYQPSIQGSVLACIYTLWESLQMLCELCTQLWMVSQPVAKKKQDVWSLTITQRGYSLLDEK